MWPSTLRWRLTLWYGVALGVPLVAFAAGCYLLFARALLGRTDRFIDDAFAAITRELNAERRAAIGPVAAIHSTLTEVRFADLRVAILDTGGAVVALSYPAGASDTTHSPLRDSLHVMARRGALPLDRDVITEVRTPRAHYRLRTQRLLFDSRHLLLAGAYPLTDIDAVLRRVRGYFLVLVPLLIVFAVLAGYFLATRPMVIAFAEQRRFMSDASHELRTPTAILRAEADVTLSQPHREEEQYRASLHVIRDAANRLTRIVEELFFLGRADAGQLVPRMEEVNLEDLVVDVARAVRPIASLRGIAVAVGPVAECPFRGDEDLLGRALLNLLDNAIKHAPDASTVSIDLTTRENRYAIEVADSGPGIPVEAQQRVFERFFRADPARVRAAGGVTSGAGLGLAIGRRIAELHGGSLELAESRPGRTVFRLSLPRPVR